MDKKTKEIIERYQCPGCVCGSDISCYKKDNDGVGCDRHCAGTTIMPQIGRIFLGLPNGFCRLGKCENIKISIFDEFEKGWEYDKFNVPAWKHLDEYGNTLVRGICPRLNNPWIHIFIGNHLDKIDCLEITQKDIDGMD